MSSQLQQLGLNEASLTIIKPTAPLDLYYRLEDCFGCSLEKLASIEDISKSTTIKLSTQYALELDFRSGNKSLCNFKDVVLNSHARYDVHIQDANSECHIKTIDKGECLFCPFGVLIGIILAMTLAESLWSRFNPRRAASSSIDPPEATKRRVVSLDAFRGMTIAGMIIVNYGGAGYMILEHKPWDGITLADFVFPFFIFAMGASIAISKDHQLKDAPYLRVLGAIIKRSMILATLGLCLNSKALNGGSLANLRLLGVLQRFSISYLYVALLFCSGTKLRQEVIKRPALNKIPHLATLVGPSIELLGASSVLASFVYLTYFFDYDSDCPIGYVGPGGATEGGRFVNCTGGAAGWIDRRLLGINHIYNDTEIRHVFRTKVTHDPEGILGYATSILLTMIGLQFGKIVAAHDDVDHRGRLVRCVRWLVGLAMSCILAIYIPINKRLWSLTFVAVTGASALAVSMLLYLLMDHRQMRPAFLVRLFISAGKNAILLYVGHSLINHLLPWHFAIDESSHMQMLLRLAWSTFFWLLIGDYMARRRLFIRV